jgi:transcriptional regulator with XRE-family HTH domain
MTWKNAIRLLLARLNAQDVERVTGYAAARLERLQSDNRTPPAVMREKLIAAAIRQASKDEWRDKVVSLAVALGRQGAADAIGCSISTINNWLYVGRVPSQPLRARIAEAYAKHWPEK